MKIEDLLNTILALEELHKYSPDKPAYIRLEQIALLDKHCKEVWDEAHHSTIIAVNRKTYVKPQYK